jgi:hypothetical protein
MVMYRRVATLIAAMIGWISGGSIARIARNFTGPDDMVECAPVPPAVFTCPTEIDVLWFRATAAIMFAACAFLIYRHVAARSDDDGPRSPLRRAVGVVVFASGGLMAIVALFTGHDATVGDSRAIGCRPIGGRVYAIESHTYGGGGDGAEAIARCRLEARARLAIGVAEMATGVALAATSRRMEDRSPQVPVVLSPDG